MRPIPILFCVYVIVYIMISRTSEISDDSSLNLFSEHQIVRQSISIMDMKKWAETRAERTCPFCNKVFCCVKCRDRHTSKEHPDLNITCGLCASKTLPMRQFEFEKLTLEDKKLLCHIAEKHLPLRCQLCSDLFESLEDLQSIGACKWKSQRSQYLISPTGLELQKSNQCLLTDIDHSRFITPSEILRKTSTPMLVGQKTNFEYHTPCVPNFSFKTPKSNSLSITQSNAISKSTSQHINTGDTDFFTAIDNITPILISKIEVSNSVRKLDIMEEQNENVNKTNTKIVADENRVSSTINMDLTCSNVDVVLQDSQASDVTRERSCRALDVVKKVRFSDQFNSLTEMESLKESCMKGVLDTSVEEEFYDAHDVTDTRNTKNIEKDKKETTENGKNTENTKDSHEQRKCSLLEQPLENSLANSKIKIVLNNTLNTQKEGQILDSTTKTQKENQSPNKKISNGDSLVTNQQSSNRMLMMVVMENNSGISTDLMPLISSSLQKLHEQLASTSCQSRPSVAESLDSGNVRRRSILKMEMSVSTVDYLVNKENLSTHQEVLSSSSLPVQKCKSNNSGGFLTAVAQAMKHAFKSFSIRSNPTRSIGTEVVEQQEIITKSTTSQEVFADQVSTSSVNNQTRPGKRNREVSEPTTRMDSRTPLAKRHKAWYTMIKGRQPIDRMRESRVSKSPRGVSTETQVFSQGSLTVRDTIIPLPARAHQSSQTE